jgi:cation:H+ antiporter
MSAVIAILLGLVLLVSGGELVVRGAGQLALLLGVRPLVVGLTVIAFSTSAPELAASLTAALTGSPGLALGNVIGSNIANVGLILGISGLVRTIEVQSAFLRREVPVLVVSGLLMLLLLRDGSLSRPESGFLLVLLVTFVGYMVLSESRAKPDAIDEEVVAQHVDSGSRIAQLLVVLVGVALLVLGANRLVSGATSIAQSLGVSERVIGLTIVAVGTSLPELASSLVATRKGHTDLVLGNVVGSNIFNVLCILGLTGLVAPLEADGEALSLDLWVMVGFSLVLSALLHRGRKLFRSEAVLLIAAYLVYVYLLL